MRAGFAGSALLILVSASVFLWVFTFVVRAAREATAQSNQLVEFGRFEAATETKMSTLRGYLLTGEETYLRQMEEARATLRSILQTLRRAVSPEERPRLDALLADEDRHERAAEEAIRLRRSGERSERVARYFVALVEPTRTTLESEMSAFLDQKLELAAAAELHSRRVVTVSLVTIASILILALLLMLSLFRFLGREIRKVFELERAERLHAEETARALAESERREHAARAAAEAAERRSAFLAAASEELSSSLEFQTTLSTVAKLAVPSVADWCFIDMIREGSAERLAIAQRDPSREPLVEELHRRHLLDPRSPIGPPNVARTGKPELLSEITDATLRKMTRSSEDYEVLRSLGLRSAMCVPLKSGDRTIGVMTFGAAESGRRFTVEDLRVAEDLARRASLAIENSRLFSEAQEAIRAREEFLSVASHELKTPITTLQLQLQSIVRQAKPLADVPSAARISSRLAVAEQQTSRLTRLVENLLDISRITAGRLDLKLERVDLNEVVRDAVARFREQLARANCPVDLKSEGEVVGTWDRLRLDQIVTNLLSNAAKYGAGHPLEVRVEANGDLASLAVSDRGIGIDPRHQKRIFRRFERAVSDRHYGGLGLGLWIVHEIVGALGGRVYVASEPGKGSTFVVELPRSGPAAAPNPKAADGFAASDPHSSFGEH